MFDTTPTLIENGNDLLEGLSDKDGKIRRYVSNNDVRDVRTVPQANRSKLIIRFENGAYYREYGAINDLNEKVSRWRNLHGETRINAHNGERQKIAA